MKSESVRKALAFIGKKGGRSKSAAKAMAARRNGRKGGRPPAHKPGCPRLQFWDAGESEARCTCK